MNDELSTQTPLGPRRTVVLVDAPQQWVRHPADLVGAIFALLFTVFSGFLAVYAQTTTLAVTSDVRTATSDVIQTVLLVPINVLEGLVSFVLPAFLFGFTLLRRRWRTIGTALLAALIAVGIAQIISMVAERWWPQSVFTSQYVEALTIQSFISLLPYVSVICAFLTVMGSSNRSQIVRIGWWLLGAVLVFSVLQGQQTITGALITVSLGMSAGMFTRWMIGSEPDRATGKSLVDLARRAQIDLVELVRVDELPKDEEIKAWNVITTAPIGYSDLQGLAQLRKFLTSIVSSETAEAANEPNAIHTGTLSNSAAQSTHTAEIDAQHIVSAAETLQAADSISDAPHIDAHSLRESACKNYTYASSNEVSRNYIATDIRGEKFHVLVLDEDQKILGLLEDIWERLRLKLAFRRRPQTLAEAAEQMTLMILSTERAGIAPERFWSTSGNESSILVVNRAISDPALSQETAETVTDAHLDAFWADLLHAHQQGLCHGSIESNHVTVTGQGLQLRAWQSGSINAPDTARRIDLAQTVSMFASVFGVQRAVASLKRSIPLDQIVALAPFLQRTIMPSQTREAFKGNKKYQELRDALQLEVPETSSAEPVALRRFSIKTIVTVTIGVVAVYLLLGSMNFEDVSAAIQEASVVWMVSSFIAGLVTYIGAGITLKAYTPERLPLRDSILVQVAASVVTLVAPAGIGPAALNLRFLQKRGVATTAALATVSLVQLAQLVTTLLLLFVLTLVSGQITSFSAPSAPTLTVIGIVLVVIGTLLLIPKLRAWIWAKIKPSLEQVWPRMVWLGTHPQRILLGLVGSVIMSAAFVLCFGFALKSFGYELPIVTLAVTYLVANSVGSAVPSPGGIGPVEAALTGGLAIAGIPYSVAFSTAVLYRLFTFWGRVPLGWVALRIADRKNII
ncbi:lysylphosphatidylglycerol synthase transmembrane domain-containing protein [Arcanobacterium bovis]|uniref:Flippase-like domain-containing protein n=1 Tax=Arcanobacterium bovis TaxID=2529275 RepID=A0A4V2KR15_9ACTO|nr:lysylphosphatidylglycerol synthase transmembrane domain-containing protein [Arcanobacterium bovis]TBW21097.1 flippase-like domain-containing protein [Arcanobacterium bovis]